MDDQYPVYLVVSSSVETWHDSFPAPVVVFDHLVVRPLKTES
jgi:hypothetical protein